MMRATVEPMACTITITMSGSPIPERRNSDRLSLDDVTEVNFRSEIWSWGLFVGGAADRVSL